MISHSTEQPQLVLFLFCRHNMQIKAWRGQWEFFWILNMDSQRTQVRYADVHCGARSYIFHEYDPRMILPVFLWNLSFPHLNFRYQPILPWIFHWSLWSTSRFYSLNFIIGTHGFFNTRENFELYLRFTFYAMIVGIVYIRRFIFAWILWFLFSWIEIRFLRINYFFKRNYHLSVIYLSIRWNIIRLTISL